MDENGANSGNLASLQGAKNRVAQECRAEALSLISAIDSQPSQNHYRHRIWHVTSDPARCFPVRHCTNCQGVVCNHRSANTKHVSSRRAACLVCERPLAQPVIEKFFSAVKTGNVVLGRKWSGRTKRIHKSGRHFSQCGLFSSRRRRRGLGAGDLSSTPTKRRNSSAPNRKYLLSSNTASASRDAASSMNSERFRPRVCAA